MACSEIQKKPDDVRGKIHRLRESDLKLSEAQPDCVRLQISHTLYVEAKKGSSF